MPSYYPIFLDLQGKQCVVVGGGSVAERKAATLLEHNASVTVISPTLNPELRRLAQRGAIRAIEREYRAGDLEGAFVAIAATDDAAINASVSEEGRQRRTLINVVDDPDVSDFIVPSLVRRGDITVAISTSGRSPALSRKLRTILESTLPPQYASVLAIVSDVRVELARRGVSVDGDRWQECLDIDALLRMVDEDQFDRARQMLLDCLTGTQPSPMHKANGQES
jgi:precorrin-2 dehydrogenase/sirohydrochlorin ferrochelatase